MIPTATQHIAVLTVSVHIPMVQSLKEKRMVLKSLKDKVRNRFNVSISELDGQNKWQIATLGIAMIGTDNRHIDSCLQNILSMVEGFGRLELCEHSIEFY